MAETVFATQQEFAKGEDLFRSAHDFLVKPAAPDEATLAAAIRQEQARVVIVGVNRYTDALYRALCETGGGQGALIARFGVGHDGIDKDIARQLGIVVCNTPGVLDISVAEHTFWLMGNLARRLSRLESRFRAGEFAGETGSELRGKRLGILGFGKIGRRVAAMARFGFGMEVWATDVFRLEELEAREQRRFPELQAAYGLDLYTHESDRLLRGCDYVSVHLPATPGTRHFVNPGRLRLMHAGAMLINTSRGSLVDEAALYDALAGGRLAGAALDVFENEPYHPVDPTRDLRRLSNVVLTPHVGSNTREANRRMAEACLANIRRFFARELAQVTVV